MSLLDVESELRAVKKADHGPRTAEYWMNDFKRGEARLTHRAKTLYRFLTLPELIDDAAKRKEAEDRLRFLMA